MQTVVPDSVPKASIQLWDQFETLNQKLAQGTLHILDDFADLLTRRANLDEEYANKLQAFAKEPMGQASLGGALSSWFTSAPKEPPIAKEYTLLKIALERPQAVALDQSTFLLEFAGKIRNEIVKPLVTFMNLKENRRKEVAPEAQKWLRTFNDAKDDVLLKRSNYQKTMQTVDQAAEALEKEDQRPVRDDKTCRALEQKLEQATEKGKAAEKEYLDAVNNANQIAREVFQNHLPPLLDELQDIEFQRQGTLLGALNVLSSLQEAYAPFLQEKFGDMATIVRKHVSSEKDYTEWASSIASKSPESEIIVFEQWMSRYTNAQSNWQRPPPIQPGRPMMKGVVSAVLGQAGDGPLLTTGPTSAPAFEEEIIDPFSYRPPSHSEPPRYIPDPEPAPVYVQRPPAGAKPTAISATVRPLSPQRGPLSQSSRDVNTSTAAVVSPLASAQRKPSPQRMPSTPSVTTVPVAPVPVSVAVPAPPVVVPLKATAVPVSVAKPVAKPTAAPTSILGAAIAAQKPSPAVTDMRARAVSHADARAPAVMAATAAAASSTSPRTTPASVPVSPRGPSNTISVAPRVVPPSINASNLPSAPGSQLSPRGGGSVTVVAQPTWERKGVVRPASERKDY